MQKIKYEFMLILLIFSLLCSSVFADVTNDDSRLFFYLPFENNLTDMSTGTGQLDFSASSGVVSYSSSCIKGSCANFSDGNNYATRVNGININTTDYTITYWFSKNGQSGTDYIFFHSNTGTTNRFVGRILTGCSNIEYFSYDGTYNPYVYTDSCAKYLNTSWYFAIYKRNSTSWGQEIYNDRCELMDKDTNNNNPSIDVTGTGQDFDIGGVVTVANFNGLIDEFRLYNRELTGAEVSTVCNDAIGASAGVDSSCTIHSNMTAYMNLSNLNSITNIPFHIVIDSNVNNSNIYHFNLSWHTKEVTYLNQNVGSGVVSLNVSMYDLENVTDNFYVTMYNENATCITNQSNIVFDFVNPVYVSYLVNNSYVFTENDNLSDTMEASFNFSDLNLDGYEVELYDVTNSQKIVYKTKTGLTGTFENYNVSLTYTNLTTYMTEGDINTTFRWNITVWDSHNPISKPVRYLPQDYGIDYLYVDDSYLFYGNEIKYGSKFTFFYLSENKYKMKITFNDDSLYHSFYINSSRLEVVKDSEYKGHLIDRLGKRYIDFEGNNVEYVELTEVEGGYLVYLKLKSSSDELELESIGDLNVVNSQQYFYLTWQESLSLSNTYLASIDANILEIKGVINMIPIFIAYFGLIVIGYWFTQTGNSFLGLPFLFGSTGVSFHIWKYYDSINIPEVGLMFAGLTLGSTFMWLFIKVRKKKSDDVFY